MTNREKVIDEVADWIDTRVIAEMVVEHVEEIEEELTVQGCKELSSVLIRRRAW